jgi:hypothetical protein
MAEEKTHILPDPIELAKESWIIYKKRFWTIVGIGVAAFVGGLLILLVAGLIGGVGYFGFGAKLNVGFFGLVGVLGILMIISLFGLSSWANAAVFLSISKWKEDRKISENIKDAKPFILPFFLTSLLAGLLSMGAFLFFVIPAFIFGIWFSMWKFILVVEGKSGLSALHTSREYVRGRFWGIVWRVIAIHLPVVILGMLFTKGGNGDAMGPIHGIFQIISLLLVPFYMIYDFVLFTHLKKTAPAVSKEIPSKSKLLYILIPLAGYLLIVITGILVVPTIMKMVSSFSSGIPGNESMLPVGKNTVKPSTAIVYGLTNYYLTNKKFPANLQVLTTSHILTSIPLEPSTGLPYRYSVLKDGQDFSLCTPASIQPEKCVSTESQSFDL